MSNESVVPILNLDDMCCALNKKVKDADNHPLLPQHKSTSAGSFRWLVTGGSGKGKSNLVLSCLLQRQIQFDHLYLYAKDPSQPKYQLLLMFLNEMEQKFEKETGEKVSYVTVISDSTKLVPLDDIDPRLINIALFDDLLLDKNQDQIGEYFVRGRHRNISCIYLSQSYYKTPKTIRMNCDYFSFFSIPSINEVDLLAREHSLSVSKEQFKEAFREATADTHSFLFLDMKTPHDKLKIRKNFDKFFISKENADKNEKGDLIEDNNDDIE